MSKLVIVFGAILIVALAMVAGAGIYKTVAEQVVTEPMLTKNDVIKLAITYGLDSGKGCSGTVDAIDDLLNAEARFSDGYWIVTSTFCAFVISDKTGKVTGP